MLSFQPCTQVPKCIWHSYEQNSHGNLFLSYFKKENDQQKKPWKAKPTKCKAISLWLILHHYVISVFWFSSLIVSNLSLSPWERERKKDRKMVTYPNCIVLAILCVMSLENISHCPKEDLLFSIYKINYQCLMIL